MLQLRPSCEHCNKPLAPHALDARICSYECTFCASCVDAVLGNVCPNCGVASCAGDPAVRSWKDNNYLGADPASTVIKHRPVDPAAHACAPADRRPATRKER